MSVTSWATLTLVSMSVCGALTLAGEDFDLPGFIAQKLTAGEKRIVVPPGRYRVTPHGRQHLVLSDLRDVEILADGVEMVCTETTRALMITNCQNVTVRGLSIDYDPLPYTQGRIVSLSDDKKIHEIELFDGYLPAEAARNSKYEIFDSQTRTLATGDHYPERIEVIDAKHLRVINKRGGAKDPVKVGDLIVIGAEHAPHGSIPHAVECSGNVNLRLEDITLYASNCFGFLESNCDGSTYRRCRIDRRPPENDPVKRADPRLRSLNADAFHSKHAVKGPAYIECVAKYMGDDAVNICGDYHMIVACKGTVLRVLAKRQLDIAAGDPVELLAYDGRRLPDAKTVAVERDGKITETERAFLLKQRMNDEIQTKFCVNAYRLTLDREVDLPMGSLIASSRRMGNGFLVQDCDFGFNRSRGILIKASNGRVVGNKLTENWGPAILVTPEYWWLESGSSNNVEIRDNAITGCRARPIFVHAQGGAGKTAPSGAHNNIGVTGNTITKGPTPNIEVTSTENLKIENNTFIAPKEAAPNQEQVKTVNCTQVTETNNVTK